MACSSPIRLYEKDIKTSRFKNHADFKTQALKASFGHDEFFTVPCRYCLNCRVDRVNEIVDRAEYEYASYGCGAFVTLTYDDYHNFQNGFVDSHDGQFKYSINKKDGKDFLNRLNKIVHKEVKKIGFNPLCRKDYKYLITHEYGDKFGRNHMHVLFFGLDFAFCERLFWRAWEYQGDIQVGAIKNGGIEYAVKYINSQEYGLEKLFNYTYHHLTPPSSSHSLGFGDGLFKSQIKYIKKTGNYRWHNTDRPVPTYYKNKYKIISDLQADKMKAKYNKKCSDILNLYNHRITSYQDFKETNLQIAYTRQKNLIASMRSHGKAPLIPEQLYKDYYDVMYSDYKNRLKNNEHSLVRVLRNDGTEYVKINKSYKSTLTTRDLMKLRIDRNKLISIYGVQKTDSMLGLSPVPF